MGAMYELVNFTRKERMSLEPLSASKAREIVWSHPAAALVVWYMLRCRGDEVALVSDYDVYARRSFFGRKVSDELIGSFKDVLEETIGHAVAARVVIDEGWVRIDEDDPDPCMRRRRIRVDDREGPLPGEGL